MQYSEIRDPSNEEFLSFVRQAQTCWKQAFKSAQNFADLEYGVVGLKNFDSFVNEAQFAKSQLKVQNTLDRVELIGQSLIDLGQTAFLLSAGRSMAGPSALAQFANLFGIFYLTDRQEISLSKKILPSSSISVELTQEIPSLEARMELRLNSLQAARSNLLQKLDTINEQIENETKGITK